MPTFLLCENLLGWLFTDTEDGLLPTFDTIQNPLPEIHIGSHRLRGPADALQDLILVEFRNALIARDEFLNTRQPAALDRMIAFLYRQPSKQANRAGRCIVPIRHETFERDVCHARRIAPWQKQTILMWFSACVKFLQTGTIVVAGEQIDMRTIFSSEETAHDTGPKFTLTDVAYELARDRALGTLNDIDEEGLYTIFQILHHNVKQAKRNAKTH